MEEPLDVQSIDESAHTTSRRSARKLRVEVITRGERRRSWSAEQKDEIVAESLGPELTPTEVARKHGISSGQLYTWRQQRLRVQTALVMLPLSKYPPAKPGALEHWPLEAAGGVADAAPGSGGH
jgi:hypothetical protein